MTQVYAEYKDSGVDWLGEIPAGWELKPLRRLVREHSGYGFPVDLQGDEGGTVPFLKVSDFSSTNRMISSSNNSVSEKTIKVRKWNKVPAGSLVTAKIGEALRKNHRNILAVDSLIDNNCIAFQPTDLNLLFCFYLHSIIDFDWFVNLGAVPSISVPKYKSLKVPLPPLPEQTAIAEFLDEKTAKIEALVAIKRRQIELLAERKQILIQNAVTKGLNPDARMKDSCVEWIGPIPAHWEVKSLNFIAHLKSGDTIAAERFKQDGYPVFGGNGFRGYTDKYTNEGNYVLIGRQGALCGNVNYASGKFFASEHAIVAYPQLPIGTRWLGEIIRKANFNRLSQSAAQPGISVEVVSKVRFPYAPIDEQREIANFIDHKEQKIDAAITIKQNQITKLNEYKTTLINAAVTGKIKVT